MGLNMFFFSVHLFVALCVCFLAFAGGNVEPAARLRGVSLETVERGIGRDHRDRRQPPPPGLGGDDGANQFCRGGDGMASRKSGGRGSCALCCVRRATVEL